MLKKQNHRSIYSNFEENIDCLTVKTLLLWNQLQSNVEESRFSIIFEQFSKQFFFLFFVTIVLSLYLCLIIMHSWIHTILNYLPNFDYFVYYIESDYILPYFRYDYTSNDLL